MEKSDSINVIKDAIDKGRPSTTDIVPGTVLHHFLYKSRANVQFTMSSYHPDFSSISRRRRLARSTPKQLNGFNALADTHPQQTHVDLQQPQRQYPRQTHPCQGASLRFPVRQFVRLGDAGIRAILHFWAECESQCACSRRE